METVTLWEACAGAGQNGSLKETNSCHYSAHTSYASSRYIFLFCPPSSSMSRETVSVIQFPRSFWHRKAFLKLKSHCIMAQERGNVFMVANIRDRYGCMHVFKKFYMALHFSLLIFRLFFLSLYSSYYLYKSLLLNTLNGWSVY